MYNKNTNKNILLYVYTYIQKYLDMLHLCIYITPYED